MVCSSLREGNQVQLQEVYLKGPGPGFSSASL